MQQGYRYECVAPIGRGFDPDFTPELTPRQMLRLGVFCGKYMTDARDEFPDKLVRRRQACAAAVATVRSTCFGVDASQPLSVWRAKGWIHPDDPRGWFQWYCRYYMGRRMPEEDRRQISRWKAMRRHIRQIERNCEPGDLSCRRRQRQALLHWAYDSRRFSHRRLLSAMRYISTRGQAPVRDFAGVLLAGLAEDGGLYVPEVLAALHAGGLARDARPAVSTRSPRG